MIINISIILQTLRIFYQKFNRTTASDKNEYYPNKCQNNCRQSENLHGIRRWKPSYGMTQRQQSIFKINNSFSNKIIGGYHVVIYYFNLQIFYNWNSSLELKHPGNRVVRLLCIRHKLKTSCIWIEFVYQIALVLYVLLKFNKL